MCHRAPLKRLCVAEPSSKILPISLKSSTLNGFPRSPRTGNWVSENSICRKFISLHKPATSESQDYYRILPRYPYSLAFRLPSLEDRHSCHLALLSVVAWVEYSCSVL